MLFAGLGVYAWHWEFNDSAFVLIGWAADFVGASDALARTFVVVLVVATGLWLAWRGRGDQDWITVCRSTIGATLILAPTVDPWYVSWILPFVCIVPSVSWIVLTGTASLSYLYSWFGHDVWWIRVLEYVPFYGLLIWECARPGSARYRIGITLRPEEGDR